MHDLISCDLCHRTILKGERIETFVGGGDRQRVCELCSLRALRSGWTREAELERRTPGREPLDPPRSLWSRALTWVEEQGLWGVAPPTGAEEENGARSADPAPAPGSAEPAPRAASAASAPEPVAAPADDVAPQPTPAAPAGAAEASTGADASRHALDDRRRRAAARAEERRQARRMQAERASEDADDDVASVARRPARTPNPAGLRDLISGRRREPRHVQAVPAGREAKIELALQLFNDSEHRRTIAGVGRTLGEPWVSAAPLAEDPDAREVGIIVAWELSWYRFRVELDEADEVVVLLDRGNELEDLDESLRTWNAGADAEGRLALAVEAVS